MLVSVIENEEEYVEEQVKLKKSMLNFYIDLQGIGEDEISERTREIVKFRCLTKKSKHI